MTMRKTFPLLIAVLLLISFIACSKADNNAAQTPVPPSQPSTSQPPASQPPAAQQPPAQAQPVEAMARPETAPARAEAPKVAPRRPMSQPAEPVAAPRAPASAAGSAAEAKPAAPVSVVAQPVEVTATPVPPTPPPPPPKPIVIASGTRFEIRLIDPINSSSNKSGDTFKATLDQDLEVDGKAVVSKGSVVLGKLISVKQSGRVEGVAALSMTVTEIKAENVSYPIQTNTLSFEAEKTTKQDATKVGIGAGVGAIIGAIAGGGKGAAIGAAVGGGAGAATVLVTKGKEVKFAAEEQFSFVLRNNLEIKR
jgi:hypothetical protein